MHQAEILVEHPVGLHARPAAIFVRTASSFPGTITIQKLGADGRRVNAKSILAVLSLGVNQGDSIVIEVEGEREEEAVQVLTDLVRANFNESGL